jgi:hypothetical protein
MPTMHLLLTMMHLCAHETPIANLEVSELVLLCFFIYLIPSFLILCGLDKRLCLSHQLYNWGHDKSKVLDETSIKLNHTVKDLNLLWVYKY